MHVLQVAAVMTFAAGAVIAMRAQQTAPRSVKDGVYTTEQANRGKAVYDDKCAECHGTMTSATPDMAPLLNDHVFQTAWKERPLVELFDKIRDTMPPNKRATVSSQQLVDLIAYILSANALPAGDIPLADDVETLKQIRFEN
jgi:mono/diheme cytochrome c family protein